jgi:hypothetical protein
MQSFDMLKQMVLVVLGVKCLNRSASNNKGLCTIYGSHEGGYEEFCLLECTPYSPLKVKGRFGGACPLHHGRRISQGRNQHEECSCAK